MNTNSTANPPANPALAEWPPRTRAERDALREQAHADAPRLRSEAIAEFWRGTDAWIADTFDHTRRAADRLAGRLRQHARQRAANGSRVV